MLVNYFSQPCHQYQTQPKIYSLPCNKSGSSKTVIPNLLKLAKIYICMIGTYNPPNNYTFPFASRIDAENKMWQ